MSGKEIARVLLLGVGLAWFGLAWLGGSLVLSCPVQASEGRELYPLCLGDWILGRAGRRPILVRFGPDTFHNTANLAKGGVIGS